MTFAQIVYKIYYKMFLCILIICAIVAHYCLLLYTYYICRKRLFYPYFLRMGFSDASPKLQANYSQHSIVQSGQPDTMKDTVPIVIVLKREFWQMQLNKEVFVEKLHLPNWSQQGFETLKPEQRRNWVMQSSSPKILLRLSGDGLFVPWWNLAVPH